MADHFVFHTKQELAGGYADICLNPFLARFARMRHGYVIEIKYHTHGGRQAPRAWMRRRRRRVRACLQYLADERLARQYPSVRFAGLAIVFHGRELAYCDAVTGLSSED